MHLETLKTFCDLAETRSFTKAAKRNFVSQSAVSQQLKALEGRFRQQLVRRGSGRGVALTDAGQLLYVESRAFLDRLAAVEDRLRGTTGAIAGSVRLATVYSIGLHELPPHVTRFMQAYPDVKVHIEYNRTDRICDACVQQTIDFGIIAFPVRRASLTVLPWQDERLVIVVPPDHRLAHRRRVSTEELAGEAFIGFERDIPTRRTIDRILGSRRVRVKMTMQLDNVETIKRAVEVGIGLSILPESTISNEIRSGTLVRLDFMDGPHVRQVGVIHSRGRALSPPAREFVRLLLRDRAGLA
jgi:DNA-binding transcriptional LysR family regulator